MGRSALVVVVAVLAGCSSNGVSTSPDQGGRAGTSSPPVAHVGDSITVNDVNEHALTIRLVKVGVVHGGTEFDRPERGDMFFGAQFRLTAERTAVADEGPWISTTVLDKQGQSYDTASVTKVREGAELPGSPRLSPGSSVLGWMVFEIPKGTKIARVQYSATGGLGGTAEWQVP